MQSESFTKFIPNPVRSRGKPVQCHSLPFTVDMLSGSDKAATTAAMTQVCSQGCTLGSLVRLTADQPIFQPAQNNLGWTYSSQICKIFRLGFSVIQKFRPGFSALPFPTVDFMAGSKRGKKTVQDPKTLDLLS